MSALSAISVPQFLQIIERRHGNGRPRALPRHQYTCVGRLRRLGRCIAPRQAHPPGGYTPRVIPLRDVIPSRTTPVVVYALIALNALAFLYEQSLTDRGLRQFIMSYGLVPAMFDWSTVFTSMFLHGGWSHFLGNMLYLWIFGDNVEDRL